MNIPVKEIRKKGAKRRDPEGLRVNARACVSHRTAAFIERHRLVMCNVKPLTPTGYIYDDMAQYAEATGYSINWRNSIKTNFNPTA